LKIINPDFRRDDGNAFFTFKLNGLWRSPGLF